MLVPPLENTWRRICGASFMVLTGTGPWRLSLSADFFSFDAASVFSPEAVPMSLSVRVSRTAETAGLIASRCLT